MPNIFPPIQGYSPSAMVTPDDQVPVPSVLGSVNAPSGASLALNGASNDLQAAQNKLAGDAPKKYDYSAHGVLGNIGHVLARTGNIVGDILDPEATSLIPNSDLYNARKRTSDMEEVDKAHERQAAAERESDQVANQDANRAAEAPLRDSEVAKNDAAAEASQHPTWQHIETDQGIFALNPKTNELMPLTYQGKPLQKPAPSKAEKPDTPEQQSIDEYQRLHPGATVAQAEHAYALNTHIQQAPQVLMMVPNAAGGSTAQVIRPGSSVAPGAQTAAGMSSTNTPTNQQRNAAGRAQQVLDSIPDVLNDLKTNAAQLGPGMGRFNEIYSGKLGAPNPEFAGLVSDLKLLGTSVAIAHAQGRMSNELLNEFNSMIAAPHQDPKNIEAVIGKVQNFMERSAKQGQVKGASSSSQGNADYHFVNGKLVKQ